MLDVSSGRPSLRPLLGRARRRLQEVVEGGLHPRRRRSARQKVRSLGSVQRVLFVCHGNIYRSPYAEAVFRSLLPVEMQRHIVALSAGFVGPGRPAPDSSVALAQQRGLDLTPHRSQLLSPALVKESHLVVVMSPAQEAEICRRFDYPGRRVLVLGDLDPEPIRTREVADPWNQPHQVLEESTLRVTRCVRELVAALATGFTAPRSG
jgi:protein-tyrosine-phosphatase